MKSGVLEGKNRRQEEHSNTHLSHMVVQDFFDCL